MNTDELLNIDVLKLSRALWQKLWVIVLSAVLCGVAAFGYANFIVDPTYVAETRIYVNNSSFSLGSTQFSISSSDLKSARTLVDTYIVILTSRSTLMDIKNEAGVSYSYGKLKQMISASGVSGTEIFSVCVEDTDPDTAVLLANTIAKVLPERIAEIVDGSSVRIVDYASSPAAKSGPNITKYTALGIVGGGVLACAVIVLLTLLDTVIHSEDYLTEKYSDIPILAVIPDLNESSRRLYRYAKVKKYSYGKGYKR